MITSVDSIQNVLSQMRAVSQVAQANPLQAAPSKVVPGGFAAELAKATKAISGAQHHAAQMQRHFLLGEKGVQLNDVMIDMQKASIGFQSAVQVRNKLVTAYQTIASMPI